MFRRAVPVAALVLSTLPLLTSPLSGKDTPEKLIREISHQLQSAGPGQFSLLTLDARLTAAHELSGQIPEESRKLLNGIRADLKTQGFSQPPDEFIYRMVECLMAIDMDEATTLALESDAPDASRPWCATGCKSLATAALSTSSSTASRRAASISRQSATSCLNSKIRAIRSTS
jgi:hypothetical protein